MERAPWHDGCVVGHFCLCYISGHPVACHARRRHLVTSCWNPWLCICADSATNFQQCRNKRSLVRSFRSRSEMVKECIRPASGQAYPCWSRKGQLQLYSFRPLTGVVGPLPNGWTSWLINGGDPITTYPKWEPMLQVAYLWVINLFLFWVIKLPILRGSNNTNVWQFWGIFPIL